MEYSKFLSDRVKPMKASAIREMFKRMANPEIISLAGGNPASELFPSDELSKIAGKILITPFRVNIAEKTVIEIKNNK